MNCPKCSAEMIGGKTYIEGGMRMFLLGGGFPVAYLAFKADHWREHPVQEAGDVRSAHYCDQCGVVTIETTRPGLSTLEH